MTPEELGLFDEKREKEIRSSVSGNVLTLHSCGIACGDDGSIALVGVSGSGKTTLGLACSTAGMVHLGDEFGFLDLDTGECWYEEYPVSIKEDSPLLDLIDCPGRQMISPCGIASSVYPRAQLISSFDGHYATASEHRRLKAFVAVDYDANNPSTLTRLSIADWPALLLPSVDGRLSRREIFDSLVTLAANLEVRVYRLSYGKTSDGVRLIGELASACH